MYPATNNKQEPIASAIQHNKKTVLLASPKAFTCSQLNKNVFRFVLKSTFQIKLPIHVTNASQVAAIVLQLQTVSNVKPPTPLIPKQPNAYSATPPV